MFGVPNLKYKTSICNAWRQGLPCQKGDFCFFAHGQTELRSMEQNRSYLALQNVSSLPQSSCKYKTTYCRFFAKGDCKLGQACTYAHNKHQKRQKNYAPKQQIMQDLNMYQHQYYPMHSDPYGYNTQQGYYMYAGYSQIQAEQMVRQQKKQEQAEENKSEKEKKIMQNKQDNLNQVSQQK